MSEEKCEICGEPMPSGETMFKYHGYSGPCPKPPKPAVAEKKRELTGHKVNGCNGNLDIAVLDEPGHGGACHRYVMFVPNDAFNQELNASMAQHLSFQNGPIKEVGTNGITHEALLAILIDRLQGFQSGQYACRENALALTKLEEAKMWLQKRTNDRLARGVEGTHEK